VRHACRQKAAEPLRYTSSDFLKMPSLKRPVRTSSRWKAMQGGADETERLLFGLGATVGSVSQNLFIIRPRYVRRKHGWPIATQTLNQGIVEAADFVARPHGRVAKLRG
jgi:hypothetical protein